MAAAFVFHIITAEIVIGVLYKQPGTSPKGDRDHEIAITATRKTCYSFLKMSTQI